ncbi:MAG: hypothetical protein ACJ0BK_05920 [Coraliomargaritaceae bacterium]
MVLSPKADDSHLNPSYPRVTIPALAKRLDQAKKSPLEFRAAVVARF